jgi:hypothetical protein
MISPTHEVSKDFFSLKKQFFPNINLPFSDTPNYAHSSLEKILSVNFKKVIEEAKAQGVDLQEIAIIYEDLTDEEIKLLGNHQVITNNTGSTTWAKFPLEGMPIIQAKAKYVYSLGA